MAVFAFLVFYRARAPARAAQGRSARDRVPRARGGAPGRHLARHARHLADQARHDVQAVRRRSTSRARLCLTGAIALWRRAVRLRASGGGGGTAVAAPPKRRVKEPPARRAGVRPARAPRPSAARESSPSVAVPEVRVAVPGASNGFLAAAFGVGVAFVLLPVLVYLAMAPDHGRFIGTCDGAREARRHLRRHGARATAARRGAPRSRSSIRCAPRAARSSTRLASSGYREKLDRKAVLFPLDNDVQLDGHRDDAPGRVHGQRGGAVRRRPRARGARVGVRGAGADPHGGEGGPGRGGAHRRASGSRTSRRASARRRRSRGSTSRCAGRSPTTSAC